MEERGPPAAGDAASNDDPPLPSSEKQLVPLPPPPGHRPQETYVVQIPKDQIYRVPPPENALIVECHRNPATKKSPRYKSQCFVICIIVFLLFLILGITLLTLFLKLHPKEPTFSITKVLVKHPKSKSSTKNSHPNYEVSLKVSNPNENMGISYEANGGTTLLFRQSTIGKGKFQSMHQDESNSKTVHLVLNGSNAALPREVEKSMNETKSKTPLPLSLKMEIPVKIRYGILKKWDMNTEVECKFMVTTLGEEGTRVQHQECEASFKR